jgi:hypothetical protein
MGILDLSIASESGGALTPKFLHIKYHHHCSTDEDHQPPRIVTDICNSDFIFGVTLFKSSTFVNISKMQILARQDT